MVVCYHNISISMYIFLVFLTIESKNSSINIGSFLSFCLVLVFPAGILQDPFYNHKFPK